MSRKSGKQTQIFGEILNRFLEIGRGLGRVAQTRVEIRQDQVEFLALLVRVLDYLEALDGRRVFLLGKEGLS